MWPLLLSRGPSGLLWPWLIHAGRVLPRPLPRPRDDIWRRVWSDGDVGDAATKQDKERSGRGCRFIDDLGRRTADDER